MDAGSTQVSKVQRKRNDKGRRSWSRTEEELLVVALKEIVASGWKSENGFKIGFLQVLETDLMKALPGTDLRGTPHINSKIYMWKKDYANLVSMLARSGIGWNDTTKIIEVNDDIWTDHLKDRATGEFAEDFLDALKNVEISSQFAGDETNSRLSKPSDDYCDETEPLQDSHPTDANREGKKVKRKRKFSNVDPICEVMREFSANTSARISDIAAKIGYEYSISEARKNVYAEVSKIDGLSMKDKLLVCKLLMKNTEDLELFFSLPQEAKSEFVQMKLEGYL